MAGSSFGDDTSVSGTLAVIEEQGSAPSAPAAGSGGILYTKADGKIYWISDDVAETDLTSGGGSAADDISTGDAAVTIATSAGNITTDAQGNNTDIIFKGTTATTDTVFLTLDGGDNTAIFAGGLRVARAAKTSAYTVLVGDYIIQCDPSSAAFTLTLPTVAAAGDGRLYVIKNTICMLHR